MWRVQLERVQHLQYEYGGTNYELEKVCISANLANGDSCSIQCSFLTNGFYKGLKRNGNCVYSICNIILYTNGCMHISFNGFTKALQCNQTENL